MKNKLIKFHTYTSKDINILWEKILKQARLASIIYFRVIPTKFKKGYFTRFTTVRYKRKRNLKIIYPDKEGSL